MAKRPGWRALAIGGALAGAAITGGIQLTGRRLRAEVDETRDDPLDPPTEVTHHRLATFDGGELHVVDTGPPPTTPGAPTVILMHGVTLQWWVWSAAIRLLRDRYRVLAWDMRGHGESRSGSEGVTLEATARDLETILVEFDVHDAVLVGHSMGGMTMGRLLASHHELAHERVGSLVFVATSAAPVSQAAVIGGLSTLSGLAGRLAKNAVRRPQMMYPWHQGQLSAVLVSTAFGKAPTARMIDDVRRMEVEMSTASMAEAASAIALHDVRADFHRVDLPTEVIVGTQDKLTPRVHAKELVRLIEGAHLEVLEGVGHQIMQERPSAIVDAVDRAVARHRPAEHVG